MGNYCYSCCWSFIVPKLSGHRLGSQAAGKLARYKKALLTFRTPNGHSAQRRLYCLSTAAILTDSSRPRETGYHAALLHGLQRFGDDEIEARGLLDGIHGSVCAARVVFHSLGLTVYAASQSTAAVKAPTKNAVLLKGFRSFHFVGV